MCSGEKCASSHSEGTFKRYISRNCGKCTFAVGTLVRRYINNTAQQKISNFCFWAKNSRLWLILGRWSRIWLQFCQIGSSFRDTKGCQKVPDMCSMGRTVSDISGHNQHWAKFLVPMCRWTPCQHFGTKIVVLRWFCREICHNIHIHMVTFEAIMDTAPYLGNLSQSAIFNFIFVISAPKLTGIDYSLPWHHDVLGLWVKFNNYIRKI